MLISFMKKVQWSFLGCFFYENICEKSFMSKLILVVIVILVSIFTKENTTSGKEKLHILLPSGVNINYDALNITTLPLGKVLTKIPFNDFSSRKK